MDVFSARILNGNTTQMAITIDGIEWSGIRCHLEGDAVVIDGDGQIPDAVKAWLADGGVPEAYVGPALAAVKTEMHWRVDNDAENIRLRYLTPGVGMAMTYQEKFAQAQAVHSMGETAANAMNETEREEQFPTLSASVGIEAPTLWDCAQLVLQKYAEFAQLSLVIERTRLAGKKAISDASDAAAVRAAYEAITWPTP